MTTVDNGSDLLGIRSVEDDIDQANVALGILNAETDLGGIGGGVQVQLDSLALNGNGVVDIGLVLETSWVQLELAAFDRGNRRLDWVTSQAENLELAWDLTEWPLDVSWTLDDARDSTAR